jgi:hypothetical protein
MMTREQREAMHLAECRYRHEKGWTADDTVCPKGVNVLDYNNGERAGFVQMLPCYGGLNIVTNGQNGCKCPHYSPLTKEEIEAREAEDKEAIARIRLIRKEIVARLGGKPGAGNLPCPSGCGGTVAFSMASNGHVHAHCSTTGCASWME